MNIPRQQTIDYLRAPADAEWRWADNAAAIVWRDGSTIAFREEIEKIIEWLAPNGLPPFGSIVHMLAAMRGKIPSASTLIFQPAKREPGQTAVQAELLFAARRQLRAQIEKDLSELTKIAELPKELRTGLQARCVLAEAVFETAKAERHVDARDVLAAINQTFTDAELTGNEAPQFGSLRQVHIVAEGLKNHTVESLTLRTRTGLDALPKEIDEDLPISERARRLIEELSRQPETGALARAARELMAAVRLPRRLGEREQLAIGGVADITNRGPLDRLLLSELAHDDLTLSVRVALNEALYLRREPPMREPPGALTLLIDSGVRLWGTPRALAAAVALALVARDKQHSEIHAWRAVGSGLEQIDLLSREGLTRHLEKLGTEAHAGKSIAAFANATAKTPNQQSVLITHPDALADSDFRRALAEHPEAFDFAATVDRNGRFEMHALPLGRRALICEADLDLDQIFETQPKVSIADENLDPTLPAIFGIRPFPFLLPLAGKVEFSIKAEDGFTYVVYSGRRLARFRDNTKGGRELTANLPPGRTIWMGVCDDIVHLIKAGTNDRPARLTSIPLDTGKMRIVELATGADTLAAHRDGDVILLIRTLDVRAYALSDGRLLGRAVSPMTWIHSRFFRGENQFYFVSWDGNAVRFEPVSLPTMVLPASVALVFDRAGLEGPWALLKSWQFVCTATGEKFHSPESLALGAPTNRIEISRDGHRLFVDWSQKRFVLKLDAHSATLGGHARHDLETSPRLPSWNLFRVVEAVSAPTRGGLAIRTRNGRWREISLFHDRIVINEVPPNSPSSLDSAPAIFSLSAKKTSDGWHLQTASWPNGSKAFLDSRGLLHLKSHDAAIPEVSLVLSDSEVAGWTSDGYVCGPKFFFAHDYRLEPDKVFAAILRFTAAL